MTLVRYSGRDSLRASLRQSVLDLLDALYLLLLLRAIYNWLRYVLNINVHLRNRRFRRRGVEDGLPLQPPKLIHFVSGVYDVEAFYHNGREGARAITANLSRNGLSMEQFGKILDFGCGCGRVLRHWNGMPRVKFFGTDYNPWLVDWCRKNLPFAECSVNALSGRLQYEEESFDLVYAISVFTHLTEELQFFWIDELRRVLRKGGYCYLSLNGSARVGKLTPEEKDAYERGELVVQRDLHPGTNTCHAYHPESWVRKNLTRGLEVIDVIPAGQPDAASQDVYLFRKR